MAKKIILVLLTHIIMGCINDCYAQCDSLYLHIYEPNKCGDSLLETVINTKHQLVENSGTYYLSAKSLGDSSIVVNVIYDIASSSSVLNDFLYERYYGCVIYKDKMFFLDKSFAEYDNIDFEKTSITKGFYNAGNKMLSVINDREVTWTFVYNEKQLDLVRISPPSTIFDFDIP